MQTKKIDTDKKINYNVSKHLWGLRLPRRLIHKPQTGALKLVSF